MGKFAPRHTGNVNDRPSRINPKVHPIWRGVGFGLMIIAPVMAFATTLMLMDENNNRHLVNIPTNLIVKWQPDPLILVKLIVTIILTIVFLSVLQMIFFIVMRIFAPPRYGPLDVPPVSFKGKPYKR